MSARFTDQVALVTGAAGGIGRAILARLRADGARIAATDCILEGVEADWHYPGDLTEASFSDGLPGRVAADAGRLDILVNNAG
ncbi:MAG: SDR family NAD(P)-dependent oxidoreductase, partial [Pseudomonadota bacterium]